MKINLAKLVLITLCLIIVAFGLLRLSILTGPLDEKRFLDALNARKEEATSFKNLRDINTYSFRLPRCGFDALLYISNFGSSAAFDLMSDGLTGKVQRFYLADEVPSFSAWILWPRYLTHQITAKMGLAPDTTWDQKLVVVQIAPACQSSYFEWNGTHSPYLHTSSVQLDRWSIKDAHLLSARSRE